mmetsp:Transcript_10302/g.22853  ORF Transcript_10302/g.22853 Transcript_10302/m.22853 type:complete len:318 (+) Transcript_10302:400-1353(+)
MLRPASCSMPCTSSSCSPCSCSSCSTSRCSSLGRVRHCDPCASAVSLPRSTPSLAASWMRTRSGPASSPATRDVTSERNTALARTITFPSRSSGSISLPPNSKGMGLTLILFWPRYRWSMPQLISVSIACAGDSTTGCPLRLKDVFSSMGMPVRRKKADIRAWNSGASDCVTVCSRAVLSTWQMAGTRDTLSALTVAVRDMYGEALEPLASSSNHSPTSSSSTLGARGRYHSLCLISSLITRRNEASRGSARIDLAPKALWPNSDLPWNHASTFPSANACAASCVNSSADSNWVTVSHGSASYRAARTSSSPCSRPW